MASDQLGRCLFGIHLCLAVLSTALAAACSKPAPRGAFEECNVACGEFGILEANAYHCKCHPPCSSEPDDG
jgi:hypothetical protein